MRPKPDVLEQSHHPQQNHGQIACLPMHDTAQTPTDYRPNTSLNDDYKLLARILARHLRTLLADYLWKTQFCGVPGNNPRRCRNRMGRYSAIRDDASPIMCAVTGFPRSLRQSCTSVLIHHSQSLRPTGELCQSTNHMYQDATSTLQINGHIAGTAPLRCSVR